jgi:hypothetical protein
MTSRLSGSTVGIGAAWKLGEDTVAMTKVGIIDDKGGL